MTKQSLIDTTLLADIRTILTQARVHLQQTINHTMVQTYWQVGRLIVEHEQKGEIRAVYGTQQLEQLAKQLQTEFGNGFDITNLRKMRRLYLSFPIRGALRPELSWTHYRRLIRIENPKARKWYMEESIEQNWSARALDRQINVLYYERLLSSKDKSPVKEEAVVKTASLQIDNKDYLRDPYILDFLNLPYAPILENKLEQSLLDNLQHFLLELGKGFAFVARQQRISTEDQDFYVDLVFYNYKLKCFLLVDIKLDKLTHQDVGQMDSYVRIYDQHKKQSDDNPTIGLILCSEKSEAVAKYSVLSDSKQLFASTYMTYLPTEEELRRELENKRALFTEQHN